MPVTQPDRPASHPPLARRLNPAEAGPARTIAGTGEAQACQVIATRRPATRHAVAAAGRASIHDRIDRGLADRPAGPAGLQTLAGRS